MPFWLALAAVVGAYVVAFYLLRLLIGQNEIAGTLAALVLGGGAYVQRAIEQRLAQPPGPVLTPTGYLRSGLLILLLGAILISGAQALVAYLQLRIGPNAAVITSIDSLLRILPPAAAAVVGVIAGQRSDRHGLAVTLGAVLGGWLLSLLTVGAALSLATATPLPPDALPPDIGVPPTAGPPPDPNEHLIPGQPELSRLVASQIPLLTGVGLLGFWYGTRTRQQAYVGGLLREVGPADREAIVELTYEAARDARTASAQKRVGDVAAREPGQRQ